MKFMFSIIFPIIISILILSTSVSAELYKSYATGMQAQMFPTVAVYNACKNNIVSEFDADMTEGRIETGKCAVAYPKYCNAARMSTMEDCVRCKHLPCPLGTYCDSKRRKCKRGDAPAEATVVELPVQVPAVPKLKLPATVNIKTSVETLAQQPIVIVALEADAAAARYVGVSLEQAGAQVDYVTNTNVDPNTLGAKHIVVIGGPCANAMWSRFSDETCSTWDFSRKGVIKAKKIDGKLGLMIAGTYLSDTFAMANVLIAQYKQDTRFGEASFAE
ncbi:MAG: hypothetical protein HY363_05990 [Candidatus Aenigmarchaeota archaeon]|nr:hypothetical protein [Candidatus Aenigmarchaeota archaeon]